MYFDEILPNTIVQIPPVIIEKEKMMAFARSYDPFPLHTDEDYAKTTPFGDLIAPGMMSMMSVWQSFLTQDLFNRELLAGISTKVEWFRPVYAGDTLTGQAEVTGLRERNAKNGVVELTIRVYNQTGVEVLRAVTESVVKKTPGAL